MAQGSTGAGKEKRKLAHHMAGVAPLRIHQQIHLLLAISYVLVYFVRIGVNDWANMSLVKEHGVDLLVANSAITMLEIGDFIGTIVAGWGSDKLFKGNRIPMNIIFMLGIMCSVGALWLLPLSSKIALGSVLFLIGFFVFGPQMLTGMAAAEVCHK